MNLGADGNTVAVHVAAMLADIGGADGLAGRCGGQDADHRPYRQAKIAEMDQAILDRADFSHGLVHQAAHQAHVGLDHGEAIGVEADAQHLDDERVAGLGAEDADGPGGRIGLGKALGKIGGGGDDVLGLTQPAAAGVVRLDHQLARRRHVEPRRGCRVDGVDDTLA